MRYSTLLVAAAALVSAQNYSTSGPLTVDTSQIDNATKAAWCLAQQGAAHGTGVCQELCPNNEVSANTCDSNTLNFTCTCANGQPPNNISDYLLSIPSRICGVWVSNCVYAHPNDLPGITACRSVQCGSKNASLAEVADSSSSASGSATTSMASSTGGAASASATGSAAASGASGSATAAASSAAASASSAANAVAFNVVSQYGTGIIAAAFFGLFGIML